MKKFFINMIPIGKLKHKLLEKYYPDIKSIVINKNTRCLVVAPHPDDETIACGGIMLKYPKNFDCAVLASAGLGNTLSGAEQNAKVRIAEFNKVMKKIGLKNFWIFKTFGVPPMYKQIRRNLPGYYNALDTKKYDYIFIPHPDDNHREHRYIARRIVKKILRHNGYKKTLKICYYGVWTQVPNGTHFENIECVQDKKYSLLSLYDSQNNHGVYYPDMAAGLNQYYGALSHKSMKYAEDFKVVSVSQYLLCKK